MEPSVRVAKDLVHRWTHLDGKKNSLKSLCEEYAKWTLPYVFVPTGTNENVELQNAKDSIGAQAVNHLSNKIVSTLFPAQRSFFRLLLDQETRKLIQMATTKASGGNAAKAKEQVAKAMLEVEASLADAEKAADEYMNMVMYRPQAINVAKGLIVTGNALIYHPEKRAPTVYSLRDYCVVRDLTGEFIEIMTKECKAYETFAPEVQAQLNAGGRKTPDGKQYGYDAPVTIYTMIRLEEDGKFHLYQQADHIELDTKGATWPKNKLPWIPLAWNLVRGEDYGRGQVADYAGAFHAINVLTGSLLNIVAVMGDIKFLVNPASHVDIDALNKGMPGSYHAGKKDDVSVVETNKLQDAQFIYSMIERYEKQISQAFLLMAAMQRNAERVTAEEIRRDAQELETAVGGIYSRLAATWQTPTAYVVLDQSGFDGLDDGIVPRVVTGMDSLSRAGEMDNLRMFFLDLQMLNTVPEPVLAGIDVPGLMKTIGTNRQVDYQQFTKTADQMAADQQAAIEQQKQLEMNKAGASAAGEAGKAAVTEGQ